MRNAQGYAYTTGPDGLVERDTFTCNHCNRITQVKPFSAPEEYGGHCRVCDKLICKKCVGDECVPFMKKIEQMEERYYRRQRMGA